MGKVAVTEQQTSTPQSLTRVWNYPLVQHLAGTAVGCYNYAKSYNAYSERVLATAELYSQPVLAATIQKIEEYSHTPTVEALVTKADALACHQLDRAEGTYTNIKEAAPKALQAAENLIQGTRAETVLVKTVHVLDSVVDALLPPPPTQSDKIEGGGEAEDEDVIIEDVEEYSDDASEASGSGENSQGLIVGLAGPVLHKLRTRVSRDAVLRVPSNTYNQIRFLADTYAEVFPILKNCLQTVDAVQAHLASARLSLQKNVEGLRNLELAQRSLRRISSSVHTLSTVIRKLDPVEARVSVVELAKMISRSKDEVTKAVKDMHLTESLKDKRYATISVEAEHVRTYAEVAAPKNEDDAVQGVVEGHTAQAEHTSA